MPTATPDPSTNYSLPSTISPNGNGSMETTATYASSWAPASLAGPNHDSGATTYDSYGRPYQTTIPDSQISQVASPVLFVRLTRLKM